MKATYTKPLRTPATFEEMELCCRWSLKCHMNESPSDEVVALFLAKVALETFRFQQMIKDNFGNVKASDTYSGQFTCFELNEVLRRNGKDVVVWFAPEGELTGPTSKGGKLIAPPLPVPDGHPQTRMRAFANRYDGALSYTDFLANGRYKEAFGYLLRADALAYVHSLKKYGYFTAPEDAYARGVLSLSKEYLKKIKSQPEEPAVDLEWEALRAAVPQLQFDVETLLKCPISVAIQVS